MNTAISTNTEAISGKADKSHTHTKSEITDFPTSLPANGGNATNVTGVVAVANGGTGATTATQAINRLGKKNDTF